jgi:hypothetical protein
MKIFNEHHVSVKEEENERKISFRNVSASSKNNGKRESYYELKSLE